MPCPQILTGITTDCKGVGGVKAIYLNDAANVTGVTINPATGLITAIAVVALKKFKVFEVRKQVAAMESTINSDDAAATSFVETTLTANFAGMNAAKRLEIMALAVGDVVAIIQDNNGKYWYIGNEFPASLTAGGGSTGTAFGDSNQYSITLTHVGKTLPNEIESTIIAALIG